MRQQGFDADRRIVMIPTLELPARIAATLSLQSVAQDARPGRAVAIDDLPPVVATPARLWTQRPPD